ncbi:hypothetical protein K501DRAFT_239363 [Backusella circina FSU 941]|nr:hypothetical protein K501DRAFT_239363 [Backusella circina FSU 941]
MTHSLSTVLPFTTRQKSKHIERKAVQHQFKPRHHVRTTSVPSVLPSYQQSKLPMDVLLDAIDLDQQMRQFFKTEVQKSKTRVSVFKPSQMVRRRSKSAPGAPPSYHQQRAFSAVWVACNRTVTNASAAQEVANLIVQKHIDSVKNR